jgi:hypothetical protein
MQQMYMYYYGMYGGFNPMMNPQYLGMNPYTSFGGMQNTNKGISQPGGNPTNNPMNGLNQLNPLGQMNPMAQNINLLGGLPSLGPMNPMTSMASMGALHNQKATMMSNQLGKNKFTD